MFVLNINKLLEDLHNRYAYLTKQYKFVSRISLGLH